MTGILFIQSRRPHGNIAGQEGLDALLAGSAFTRCAILFLEDGVLQLVKHQDTTGIGVKNYSLSYGTLKDYGVTDIYCDAAGLDRYGLEPRNLVIEVTPVTAEGIGDLIERYKTTLCF